MRIYADDPRFRYVGRWSDGPDGRVSHWCRPYIEFRIKASYVSVDCTGEFTVSVDGAPLSGENGRFLLPGTQWGLVRITVPSSVPSLVFSGIETDGEIDAAPSRPRHILFIGDSLTAAPASHSVILPRELDADYTCIAVPGLAFCAGRGYYALPADRKDAVREGMEHAFFNLQSPSETGERTAYDLSLSELPDTIFIGLGTNDHLTDDTYAKDFIVKYIEFIGKVRHLWPNAEILLLLPVADTPGGFRRDTIEQASLTAAAQFERVRFISSRDWDVEISKDNVHPTETGYEVFARELLKQL